MHASHEPIIGLYNIDTILSNLILRPLKGNITDR